MSWLTNSASSAGDWCRMASTVSGMPAVSSMTCRDALTEVGEPARIFSARARAPSRAVPASTTARLTRPWWRASSAVSRRPVRIISVASLLGIAPGSRTPAGAGDEPDPELAERERAGGVGDDQVAGDCDLTTAAHGVAVDRSDDWFGEVLPAGEAGEIRSWVPTWVFPARSR